MGLSERKVGPRKTFMVRSFKETRPTLSGPDAKLNIAFKSNAVYGIGHARAHVIRGVEFKKVAQFAKRRGSAR